MVTKHRHSGVSTGRAARGRWHPVVPFAVAAVLAITLGACSSSSTSQSPGSAPADGPPGESGLTWITIPPQDAWNAAALEDVTVGEIDGCLGVGDIANPLYPVFAADDPFPGTLEVGDVISLGGSASSLEELGDVELTIPPQCEGVTNIWFSAPQG